MSALISVPGGRSGRAGDPRSLAGRPSTVAERLGQVFTPKSLAREMALLALGGSGAAGRPLRILDPCVGPGTFPAALNDLLDGDASITALDIDPAMVAATRDRAWSIRVDADVTDYLQWEPPYLFDAAILNPPYLRQEWIDSKDELRRRFKDRLGVQVPGTANAYVYFLVKALQEVRAGGRVVAIVYDSWLRSRYGEWLQRYLECHTTDLKIRHVPNQPFDGRLIDATIICATPGTPIPNGSRPAPDREPPPPNAALQPIEALYETRRGLRLKETKFFLCSLADAQRLGATQFLKHVRYVDGFKVSTDHPQAALLIRQGDDNHPALTELRSRLDAARARPDQHVPILTWAAERPESWYSHREAPRAPIVFNYYMRGTPRHLLNPGIPYADNFYGLTPRHDVSALACLAALNSRLTTDCLQHRSRSQGGGLSKIQLYEYREVLTPAIHVMTPAAQQRLHELGQRLTAMPAIAETLDEIDHTIRSELSRHGLLLPVNPSQS